MKNKIGFGIAIVLSLVIFVGSPLFVQYIHWPSGSNGNGDWLGFWGSYLGIIPSGLIAYVVAKIQIRQEKINNNEKELKSKLPFFDTNSILKLIRIENDKESYYPFQIRMLTTDSVLPVRKVTIELVTSDGEKILKKIPYLYPNKEFELKLKPNFINFKTKADQTIFGVVQVQIWCRLLDGTKIYYRWGSGTTEYHCFKTIDSDSWVPYIDGENKYFKYKEDANREFD